MAPSKKSRAQSPENTRLRGYGGINALIEACNTNDRFKLVEDHTVLKGNLTNSIHPALDAFALDKSSNYTQALRFASHLLSHDPLLIFFVPLLYGRELETGTQGSGVTFLSDPLANVSDSRQREYIDGVREGLKCVGHRTKIKFSSPVHRVYARTTRSSIESTDASTCCSRFQNIYSPVIEISDHFQRYYENGYGNASLCAQFRHDFLFATTLVHEMIHAFGVLRRGDLHEPQIRADDPNHEWGWAWENFMFGCIINPQKRSEYGTHLLMRKVWAKDEVAEAAGGKEYCDVPMAWVAKWFREETWAIVAEQGPTAVPPPTTHFKIQSSNKLGSWIISSDLDDVKDDLLALYSQWKAPLGIPHKVTNKSTVQSRTPLYVDSYTPRMSWRLQTTDQLQKSNLSVPVRDPRRMRICTICEQVLSTKGQRVRLPTHQLSKDPSGFFVMKKAISECSCACRCTCTCEFAWSRSNVSRKRSADNSNGSDHSANKRRCPSPVSYSSS